MAIFFTHLTSLDIMGKPKIRFDQTGIYRTDDPDEIACLLKNPFVNEITEAVKVAESTKASKDTAANLPKRRGRPKTITGMRTSEVTHHEGE